MIRPLDASRGFVKRLSRESAALVDVIYAPLLQIVPKGESAPEGDTAVIFTSSNAVAFAGPGNGRNAFCVGERTAQNAEEAGWDVAMVATEADSLVDALTKEGVSGPLIHLAGAHRRGDIAERLNAAGIKAKVQVLYEAKAQDLPPNGTAALKNLTILPLFSPRSAAIFMQQKVERQKIHAIALSPIVAKGLDEAGFASLCVLSEPKGEMMAEGVESLIKRLASP